MPNGDPWTQDYLLAQMQETIGWAPYRPNYSKYEQPDRGSVPNRDTLAKFVAFWATRGEPGPDLAPVVQPPDPLVAAILAQTAAITALVEELRLSRAGQVEATEIAFQALGALGVDQARKGTPAGSAPEVPSGTGR